MKTKIITIVLAFNSAIASHAINKHSGKPNIIIFMADDMGYGDAGFTGAKDILTPNLDELLRLQYLYNFRGSIAYL